MTYPGGKNGAGVYQRIISHMPPHAVYIEAFLGSGAIIRNKRPAGRNIGIDPSQKAIDLCRELAGDRTDIEYVSGDALWFLSTTATDVLGEETLIYCDPPYMMETRKGGDLYDHELTDSDHIDLLIRLNELPCMIMLSGYRSTIYDHALKDWHRIDYMAQTRQGQVEECLWMNFAPPVALHDYGHLGNDYRDRERIKRKKARWTAKIKAMDRLERLAIMEALTTAQDADMVVRERKDTRPDEEHSKSRPDRVISLNHVRQPGIERGRSGTMAG